MDRRLNINTLESHMIPVEGGRFQMGDRLHQVKIRDFHICRFLVSQELYLDIMGNEHVAFSHAQKGIEHVSWYEAVTFCNVLSEYMKLKPYYQIHQDRKDPGNKNKRDDIRWLVLTNPHANGYRLPTEAEWEYAARGGKFRGHDSVRSFAGSRNLSEVAWHAVDSGNSHKVNQSLGLKRPNALGLYDISGNLWEWCWDWYDREYFKNSVIENPLGPPQGSVRVARGGSWISKNFDSFGTTFRYFNVPNFRYNSFGFRLSRY